MRIPNVLVTLHQAFLTKEALQNIAQTTLSSVDDYERTGMMEPEKVVGRF